MTLSTESDLHGFKKNHKDKYLKPNTYVKVHSAYFNSYCPNRQTPNWVSWVYSMGIMGFISPNCQNWTYQQYNWCRIWR